MGDPTQSTRYELCIYDGRGVRMAMGVDSGPGWTSAGSRQRAHRYKYKDSAALQDGVKIIKSRASNLDRAWLQPVGKGEALPDGAGLPLQYPVTAQLYASDGACWDATFDQTVTLKNDGRGYTAKTR